MTFEKSFNPFTAPARKFSGLKDARTCMQKVYFPIFNAVRFDENPSHASVKKKTKRPKGFEFRTFIGRF